ncbi:MAG: TetR/AcrR family transcriptional regulator [Flavobacteriaceae bacterium]
MSWRRPDRDEGKRGYHHGNLREALVDAAMALIAERGPEGVTLAEVARMAGVSTAAPYRHFKDRDALMTEVAKRGFSRFADRMRAARHPDGADAVESLMGIGRAYMGFARNEPALYSAMFEGGVSPATDGELRREADRAFEILLTACERIRTTLPEDKRAPALMMALHIWSLSHGVASLFARGDRGRRAIPVPPEDLLEAGTLIYLRGLGYEPGQ